MQVRLQEIRDRVSKATAVPWEIAGSDGVLVGINGPSGYDKEYGPVHGQLEVWGQDDADFIANARRDVPYLLDELQRSLDRERALRNFIDIEFCTNFKTLHQKSTICHHPDAGECDKYHECRALDKILKQEVVDGD